MLLICLVTIAETDRRLAQGITPAVASENSGSCLAIEPPAAAHLLQPLARPKFVLSDQALCPL